MGSGHDSPVVQNSSGFFKDPEFGSGVVMQSILSLLRWMMGTAMSRKQVLGLASSSDKFKVGLPADWSCPVCRKPPQRKLHNEALTKAKSA